MPEEERLSSPLAIIGNEDLVAGFKALGFKVYKVKAENEFKIALEKVIAEKNAICLIQDNIYASARSEIDKHRQLPLPVFVPFIKDTAADLLDEILRSIRLKATGAF